MGRGLTVKVLTNSLASTDSALAQGGYARYRKPLLQTGVELYELKPNPDQKRFWDTISLGGSSRGALHAKTLIVDGQVVFVGSFNLDPRSARLDTQNGIVIRSGELAAQARRLFARGVSPSNAYRVQLAAASPDAAGGRGLIWVTEENGREVRYFHDPRTGMWRRLGVKVLSWLAPESML
jgi:putative cardiolipin synthase